MKKMTLKSKFEIGQILRYKSNEVENISEVTSIEFNGKSVIYHFKHEQLSCDEKEVLTCYFKKQSRVRSKKVKVSLENTESLV